MNKLALPALILCIFSLLAVSARSQSNDAPPDLAAPRAEVTQKPGDADKATQDRDQQLTKTLDGIRAELQRLSDDAKANSDKVGQTVMLRSDLLKLMQDSKSGSEKTAKIMLDQIDALRAEQVKFLTDAKAEVDALKAQADTLKAQADTLKADAASSEALAQRLDAMKKDIDGVKKNVDEVRQNTSDISPGLALIVALAALVLGPLVSRQFAANQLAAGSNNRHAVAETAAAAQSEAHNTDEEGPPLAPPEAGKMADEETQLAPPADAELPQQAVAHHDEPATDEPASPYHDARADEEKV